jgi:hypothetical protein
MADNIDWGILQSQQQMAPIRTASPQAQPMAAPNPDAGAQAINQAAQTQIERQKLGLLQNEDKRAQGMYPGQLTEQSLHNQGMLQGNQSDAIKLKLQQQEYTHHQADLQAYQKGGIDAYSKSLESHDPMAATNLRTSIENTKEAIRTHGTAAVDDTANLFHTIVPPDYNPQDPKAQAQLMQNYNNNKTLLNRLDPKLQDALGNNPTPSQVANYAMGTVSTVYGYKQQQALQGQIRIAAAKEDLKPTPLLKAQRDVQTAQEAYDSIQDKQSPEAIQALQTLNETKQGVSAELNGHNPLLQQSAGLMNTIAAPIKGLANGVSNLFSPAPPNAPQQGQTPPMPQGAPQMAPQGQPQGMPPQGQPGNTPPAPQGLQAGTIGVNAAGVKARYIGGDPSKSESYEVIQ